MRRSFASAKGKASSGDLTILARGNSPKKGLIIRLLLGKVRQTVPFGSRAGGMDANLRK